LIGMKVGGMLKDLIDPLYWLLYNYPFFYLSGKRRALIPPSVGYVNENLKPIPDEVILLIMCPRLHLVSVS